MSNPNTEILKKAYKNWHDSKGDDVDHWMNLMTEDVEFCSLASPSTGLEFTSTRLSKNEVAEYFAGLTGTFEMIHYTADQYVSEADTVIMIGSTVWRNKQTGKEFDTPKVDVVKFKNGKICSFYEYYDTAMVRYASM